MGEVQVTKPGFLSSEISRHDSIEDCWIIVKDQVYDVTTFLQEHPGGANIILRYAGKDATTAYEEVHAPGVLLETLPMNLHKGWWNKSEQSFIEPVPMTPNQEPSPLLPELHTLISPHDFETVAKTMFSKKAFAFFSSAATDLVTLRANAQSYHDLMLRPRVLRNVRDVCIKRKILGHESSAPFFVSPAAMAKLAHSEGEIAISKACGVENIIQIISSNASYPLSDIVSQGHPNQVFFLQLYVNTDRSKTKLLLEKAKTLGIRAIFLTVDAPIPGKREADERISTTQNMASGMSGAVAKNDKKGGGIGRVMAKYIDSSLNWADLEWVKEVSGLPLVLKGIQCAADARKAVSMGVEGIMLSNHGGRSLDTVQPAILTLLELHKHYPEIFGKVEIFTDGGITRGTDIVKALALGATAVGIGRPYLYSLAYGQAGVEHLTQIYKDELISAMKLSGITNVEQAHPGMVNTSRLDPLIQGEESHPWIQWKAQAML